MAEELKKGWCSIKGGAVHKLVMQKVDGSDRLKNWVRPGRMTSISVEKWGHVNFLDWIF